MDCTENGKTPNLYKVSLRPMPGARFAFSETDQTGLESGVEDLCFISMMAVKEALDC